MFGFKEEECFNKAQSERILQSRPISTTQMPKPVSDFAFSSPELTEDQNEALSFSLGVLEGALPSSESDGERISNIHQSIAYLSELILTLGPKIYTFLDVGRYDFLIKLLNYPEFSEECIYLLSDMFWSDVDPLQITLINLTCENPVFMSSISRLINSGRELTVKKSLTYLSNIIKVSSPVRMFFLKDNSIYLEIMHLPDIYDKWKLSLLLNILDGPLLPEDIEREIINSAVMIASDCGGKDKFCKLLNVLVYLTEIDDSTSRDIICKEHLVDKLTIIASCEKYFYRCQALRILSNCTFYGEEMLREMIRFNTVSVIVDIFKQEKNDCLIVEAAKCASNWLLSADNSDEYKTMLLDKIADVNYVRFLKSYSYQLKKNVIRILSRFVYLGSYEQDIRVISPPVLEQICSFINDCSVDYLVDSISLLDGLFDTCLMHEEIEEIVQIIVDNVDFDQLRDLAEDEKAILQKIDTLQEKIDKHIGADESD